MKRQLDEKERKLSEKSIDRLDIEIDELQENLEYNKALLDKQAYLRDFDDTWRQFLRDQKDKEDEKLLDQMKSLIDDKKRTVEQLQKQINEGVEKPTGV